MGNFTFVDVVVALVLLGSAGFAFMRGFVHEVLAIFAWVGAVFAALYGFTHVQPFFRQYVGTPWLADAAAAATLFLVTLLVLSLFSRAASIRIKNSALNSVDSSLGFVFGIARGAVILTLTYMGAAWAFHPDQPDWLIQAKTRPWLERGAVALKTLAPAQFGMAEGATKAVSAEAQHLRDAEKAFQKFVAPQPAAPAPAGAGSAPAFKGYDDESRSQLNRLLETTR